MTDLVPVEIVQDARSSRKNGRLTMPIEQPFVLKKGTASNIKLIEYLKSLHVVRDALSIESNTEELLLPPPTDGSTGNALVETLN